MSLKFIYCTCIILFLASCNTQSALFKKISSSYSGIHFNNVIVENDSINPLDMEFLYNGGGVAVGDFNNDNLPDLYFTASTTQNKLYLNEGDLSFKDVTDIANVGGNGEWSNAATVVDINGDGLQDIYVCTTIKSNPQQRKNLLYINEGLNENKIPVYKEMAKEYGLADTSFSVQAAFFDYDNDGDLDMYLVTTKLAKRQSASFSANTKDTSLADVDKLFRNDWSDALHHPVFTDVSKETGITAHGFGLGVAIADINKDGWKDVYVTNDFYGSDHLYINNHDGTFTDRVKQYFKHTSQNAMGNDVADINNDGLADVMAVDMNPEDNLRKKKNMNSNNYFIYQNMLYENLELQYVRNTLQLNMGPGLNSNGSVGEPIFADISFLSSVAETDWSWNVSLADFDNDGWRDIIITNGYPRDVTDHDFAAFRNRSSDLVTKKELIDQIPQIKIANYAFKNNGNLSFENVTNNWGMSEPSFSNGAVYADLDNDGDLDYVISNINDEAFVYENTTNTKDKIAANYLIVKFKGDDKNLNGIGAWAEIYYSNKMQVYENEPCRGYLSCVDTKAFFGMGNFTAIDSVIFRWADDRKQILYNVKTNQTITAEIKNATAADSWQQTGIASNNLFTDCTASDGIHYMHQEMDYIDFDKERLLPHKLSQYGPGLASGDIDGNGLDDIFIGGTGDYPGKFFLQQSTGKFIMKDLPVLSGKDIRRPENMGLLLFDADKDGDLDLYCASGSNEFSAGSKNYQDQFFMNSGKGDFIFDTTAFPKNYTSKSCVKAFDFDNDGDLDLFIGGKCMPGKYPQPVSSFIYRNDTKDGKVKFIDATHEVANALLSIGMVCDAICTDFDNDGFTDLILAGEWMPLVFLKNNKGRFENISAQTGLADKPGWWNSITGGDFDNDGDIDYIAGNTGTNSFFRASDTFPVKLYAKDFDNNGSIDPIITVYLKDEQGNKKEFPAFNRDDIVNQLPYLKKKFLTYKEFGAAGIHEIFDDDELKDAQVLQANCLSSAYIENIDNGKFQFHALPVQAQLAPLNGMIADDFNNDGNLDIAVCGNDFGNEVTDGRYDAMNGLVLSGDGKGNFAPQTILQSGFFIPGDAKALVSLRGAGNRYLIAASQNRDALKLFCKKDTAQIFITVNTNDKIVLLTLYDGSTRKQELYYGNSFLSQAARFVCIGSHIKKAAVVDNSGIERIVFSR